jgi:hypothetical protein
MRGDEREMEGGGGRWRTEGLELVADEGARRLRHHDGRRDAEHARTVRHRHACLRRDEEMEGDGRDGRRRWEEEDIAAAGGDEVAVALFDELGAEASDAADLEAACTNHAERSNKI